MEFGIGGVEGGYLAHAALCLVLPQAQGNSSAYMKSWCELHPWDGNPVCSIVGLIFSVWHNPKVTQEQVLKVGDGLLGREEKADPKLRSASV